MDVRKKQILWRSAGGNRFNLSSINQELKKSFKSTSSYKTAAKQVSKIVWNGPSCLPPRANKDFILHTSDVTCITDGNDRLSLSRDLAQVFTADACPEGSPRRLRSSTRWLWIDLQLGVERPALGHNSSTWVQVLTTGTAPQASLNILFL